ncbi:MAG TPA: MFS transporter [Rhabdochlamydiaceae bacterium]|nr:MFS transporter [Rhabdochlamydiaceae bacterium]
MNTFFKSKMQEVLFIGIILFAFISFYIETDIYTPSFPQMLSYFGTNEDTIQRLLSMNFLGLCLSCLFFGPASDAYGRKPILCTGLSIFLLGSLGCALTDSLSWMIAFRFLQGVGCGSITSAALTLFFDVYPPDQSSRLVAVCNGTIGGMMALAPMLGNWISIQIGWRANFYLIAAFAALSCFSVWFFIKETLPTSARTRFNLSSILKGYFLILKNFPFMAHTFIWCLAFSMVIVFVANLSLIFVDYLQVPKEVFGYYQTAIMGAFFIGSMGGAYLIKKLGMIPTKAIGSLAYITGVVLLVLLTFLAVDSPLLIIVAMSVTSLGSALAMTIYFTYSMTYLEGNLKGASMALTQSLRLFLSSGLVWCAARGFDGSTWSMSILAIICTAICSVLYAVLYLRKQHLSRAGFPLEGR